MVAEGDNDEIEDAAPNVPFATGLLMTESGPTTGVANVNLPTLSSRANVTQHEINIRDIYPNADNISPVERSSISSGVPSILQNEMQDYIRMRVNEAEQEAIREFIESKSLRNIPTIQGNNSGNIAAIAAEPVAKTPKVVETRTIHRSYMKDIPAGVLSSIQKNCINKQPLKRALLRDIHIQLQSCGLLTMLLGQRTRPEYSMENPTGYREPYTVAPDYNSSTDDNGSVASDKSDGQIEAINLLNGLSKDRILIPADNLELWQHDEGKLLVLVREMFHSRHYPFAETEFRRGLPVPYYNKLYDHVFSKLAVDLDYHESC